jgi:hypothetical protein
MNRNEMVRVILDIARELFRCYCSRLSSRTVSPSLHSPSPADANGATFPGIVRAEGAGRRWPT